jgi:copper chaperone
VLPRPGGLRGNSMATDPRPDVVSDGRRRLTEMGETVRIKTTGMHCQSCSMLIEMNLDDVEGVESARADFRDGVTEVVYDPGKTGPAELVAAIQGAGYGAELEA